MAKDKKRRSFLDAPLSEIEKAGKELMSRDKEENLDKRTPKKKEEVKKVKEKRKFVYLDESVHRIAKVKASQEGKTIKAYISDLILNA